MSIEITFHPDTSDKKLLKALLMELGFQSCSNIREWPKGSLHFHWFSNAEYASYDGVEASIYPPSEGVDAGSPPACPWALHTRTRTSASPSDRRHQNHLIRTARARLGGAFYNDSEGKNRYIKIQDDGRDAPDRGIYLAYESVRESISAVQFALPDPLLGFQRLTDSNLEALAEVDPTRVLYNALVPFTVAAVEHFLSRAFKALLEFDPKARERLHQQTRKIEMADAIAIAQQDTSIEDVIVGWYSFQNLNSIHKAFSDWFGLDFRGSLRRRRRVGRRMVVLDTEYAKMIEARHGLIHRLHIDRRLQKHTISELLDATMAVIDAFVDHLEFQRSMHIRDRA